jgi:hypothetical protein
MHALHRHLYMLQQLGLWIQESPARTNVKLRTRFEVERTAESLGFT